MKSKLVFLFLFLITDFAITANITNNSGTVGFVFLKMPTGVRAQGMGENFVAVSDDVSSIFYNPSGIIKIKEPEISAEHILWFESITKSNLNFVYPKTIIGPVGIGINYVAVPYEKRITENDESYQSASVWMGNFQVSWAKKVNEKILFGSTIKYITEKLDIQQTQGVAIDIGSIYEFSTNKILLGVSLQNLGIQFGIQNPDSLPMLFRCGLAKKFLQDKLFISSDLNYGIIDGTVSLGIGAEYLLGKYFLTRVGYKYLLSNNNLDFISGINVGFGIRYKKIGFDYSVSPKSDLGIVHLISINMVL